MIELLIMNALQKRELTMYGVSKHIEENFSAFTRPSFGAIKPALRRLEKGGFLTLRKTISDGGKLSVFYTITKSGQEELVRLLLEPLSANPLQFLSNARVKLCCAGVLNQDEKKKLFLTLKLCALAYKNAAEAALNDEYNRPDFYRRIVLDNAVCEYKNLVTIIEGFEKDNGVNEIGER